MTKEKRLKIERSLELRCSENSPLGQVISYLQKMPLNNSEIARSTLISRYLPFTLEPTQEDYRAIALVCAVECESWGRAIREYCALPPASGNLLHNPLVVSQHDAVVDTNSSTKKEQSVVETERVSAINDKEEEFDKFILKLQEIVDTSSSAIEAKERLNKLQPEKGNSWTEGQWRLWEEFVDKQEIEANRQLLGDWGN